MAASLREFEEALKGRVHETGVVDTTALVFSDAVRKACADNICGNFDKSWTCPPACGSMEEMGNKIRAFNKAFIFTTKTDLEDSFDFEGMTRAKGVHDELTRAIHEKFGRENPVYGAGGCRYCADGCAYPAPCPFPDKVLYSIEASGINVMDLSKTAGVHYINGQDTVTFFSMILFNG